MNTYERNYQLMRDNMINSVFIITTNVKNKRQAEQTRR